MFQYKNLGLGRLKSPIHHSQSGERNKESQAQEKNSAGLQGEVSAGPIRVTNDGTKLKQK